jgi:lipid II:glycine glycyltransferase (peptidoglycan interpeptide bridge formation enzyme)
MALLAGLSIKPSQVLARRYYRRLLFFSGPAAIESNRELTETCLKHLVTFAAHHGYSRLHFGSWDYPHPIGNGCSSLKKKNRKEYIIDLRSDLPSIKRKVKSSVRRKARQVGKKGVVFHETYSSEALQNFISLLDETKRIRLSKGYEGYCSYYMPFLDEVILSQLLRRKAGRLFVVERKGKTLSADFAIVHGNRAFVLLNATSAEGYKIGARKFLLLSLIEKTKKEGIEYLNLGGVAPDSSANALAFFKHSFGAEEQVCEGGSTAFLGGPLLCLNPILNFYQKAIKGRAKRSAPEGFQTRPTSHAIIQFGS